MELESRQLARRRAGADTAASQNVVKMSLDASSMDEWSLDASSTDVVVEWKSPALSTSNGRTSTSLTSMNESRRVDLGRRAVEWTSLGKSRSRREEHSTDVEQSTPSRSRNGRVRCVRETAR